MITLSNMSLAKIWSWQTGYHGSIHVVITVQLFLHHNIQTIHFNSECLNIIRGTTERDPIHSTLYKLTLNGWPGTIRTVPHIAHHFWGT